MAGPENNGTEAPTPRRREEARNEGQVVFSSDLTASVALLTGCLMLMWNGSGLATRIMNGFREWFLVIPRQEWTAWHINNGSRWLASEMMGICGSLVLGLMGIGLAFSFAQVGFHISFKSLEIKWDRVLPENGWSRIISLDSGIKGLMNAVKVAFLLSVTLILLWVRRTEFSISNFSSVTAVAAFAWNLGLMICIAMAGVSIGLALIDYLIKWFRNEQKLMMTREKK